MRPSFIGHIMNALLLLIALVLSYVNRDKITADNTIVIILLMSIAIGIHAILHHIEEIVYGFNPLK